jgi:hypothetical protein
MAIRGKRRPAQTRTRTKTKKAKSIKTTSKRAKSKKTKSDKKSPATRKKKRVARVAEMGGSIDDDIFGAVHDMFVEEWGPPPVPPRTTTQPYAPSDLWKGGNDAHEVGEVAVPSGAIALCDAGTLGARVALELPKGSYGARTVLREARCVAGVLYKRGETPTAWKLVGAFDVETSIPAFFDAEALERLDTYVFKAHIYDDWLYPNVLQSDAGAALVAFEWPPDHPPSSFFAWRAGTSDGVYAHRVYEGRNARGAVVCVVATFATPG